MPLQGYNHLTVPTSSHQSLSLSVVSGHPCLLHEKEPETSQWNEKEKEGAIIEHSVHGNGRNVDTE